MPKAYWIACYREIIDQDKLAAYAKIALPAIVAGGGKFLARGMAAYAFEAGLKERTVLIEFPDMAAALATHDSPAYQEALALLKGGAVRDLRFVEGA
ncbi:MAG TPA: DUF1330 domain-containing protein [Magnetospirillaceae bacterium]|nr:DUF1330 domain-containing protein [Magnetospirillaceae bacterium]